MTHLTVTFYGSLLRRKKKKITWKKKRYRFTYTCITQIESCRKLISYRIRLF